MPLAELGGRAIPLKKSLDLAAEALDALAKPVISHWLYRLMSGIGWRQRAKHYGALKSLRRQPYLAGRK